MIIEVSNTRRCSGKANRLRYIYTIRGTSKDIIIKERKINSIKIKNEQSGVVSPTKEIHNLNQSCEEESAHKGWERLKRHP